jgi:excisionase family DNA binding protein
MKNLPLQLSVREASEVFNIPQNTLRAYIHRRIIPFRKVKGRVYLVTETISDWLSSFDVEPRQPDHDDND